MEKIYKDKWEKLRELCTLFIIKKIKMHEFVERLFDLEQDIEKKVTEGLKEQGKYRINYYLK